MLFRNRSQNIPVVAETLFRRPVGYLFALDFYEAGVFTYDSSPLSSAILNSSSSPTAELQCLTLRVILS